MAESRVAFDSAPGSHQPTDMVWAAVVATIATVVPMVFVFGHKKQRLKSSWISSKTLYSNPNALGLAMYAAMSVAIYFLATQYRSSDRRTGSVDLDTCKLVAQQQQFSLALAPSSAPTTSDDDSYELAELQPTAVFSTGTPAPAPAQAYPPPTFYAQIGSVQSGSVRTCCGGINNSTSGSVCDCPLCSSVFAGRS